MTAFAMIIGMIPMALGLGEGAEQNAPLGRAVIGGLLFATVSTLFFVPLVFAGFHSWLERRHKNGGDDNGGGDNGGEGGGSGGGHGVSPAPEPSPAATPA
jgi:uncharacterized membrane protein YgcG